MPFWRSYAHLIWATKNRNEFISSRLEPRLYAQMVKRASDLGCYVLAINGMPDHVHLITTIPPTISAADVVKTLKGSSSHFVNHIIKPVEFHFAWQRGYGFLSLGQSQLPDAIAYVQRQKEHHRDDTWHPWLERYSDLDDGPENPSDLPKTTNEAFLPYLVDEDYPF